MKKILLKIIFMIVTLSLMTACTAPTAPESDGIKVVSVIFPYYDFAKNICGDKADVSVLINPGADVHSFEPTAKDINRIQSCDLFIYTGGESDAWVENILGSLDTKINTLKVIDVVALKKEDYTHFENSHHEDHSVDYDEHVWTSPDNAIKIAGAIENKLCTVDVENSAVYEENTKNYVEKIEEIANKTTNIVENSKRRTIIIGDRFPMLYYAEYYGLEVFAAFPGCAEKTEPSAATLAFLADKIKTENIPVVFKSELSGGQTAEALCSETGAKCLELAACHNVSKQDFDSGVGYMEIMEKNAQALTEALN